MAALRKFNLVYSLKVTWTNHPSWPSDIFSGGTINDVGPSHSHIQWVPGDLSSGIKGRGEADHSYPFRAQA